MRSLFIDTSSSHLIMAIIDGDKIVSKYNEKVNTDMSVYIFPELDNIFKESKMVPKDIDTIFVVNGPGSFTGIRVGLTLAKVYAWTLKKKVIPISSLELLATTKSDYEYIIPLIDARRDYVYTAIYDKNLNCILNDRHIPFEQILNEIPSDKDYIFVSYDQFSLDNLCNPNVDIVKIVKRHERDKGVNPHSLNPNYLKLTEAEENLNRKNNND